MALPVDRRVDWKVRSQHHGQVDLVAGHQKKKKMSDPVWPKFHNHRKASEARNLKVNVDLAEACRATGGYDHGHTMQQLREKRDLLALPLHREAKLKVRSQHREQVGLIADRLYGFSSLGLTPWKKACELRDFDTSIDLATASQNILWTLCAFCNN